MNLLIVTEGTGEINLLRSLAQQCLPPGSRVIGPILVQADPYQPANSIAERVARKEKLVLKKQPDRLLFVMDQEGAHQPVPQRAAELKNALATKVETPPVVCLKVICIENWLIADPDGLDLASGRFSINQAFRNKVAPNLADGRTDSIAMLEQACSGSKPYHKVNDLDRLAGILDPQRMIENSRSFRRFAKLCGYQRFRNRSSCQP